MVMPVADPDTIAPGLRGEVLGANDPRDPHSQIGSACLADQTVGQVMAHVCGLGHLSEASHQRATLRTLMRHNFRRSLHDHANHMRTYALGHEAGMLLASYPHGDRPARPFPYFSEVWTGVEYTAAAHMLYEGMHESAVRCVEAARARHDGECRNPYDDVECGHHYARSMAAWALLLAHTGGRFEVVATAAASTAFWSNGDAWGSVAQRPAGRSSRRVTLRVTEGRISVASVVLAGHGRVELPRRRVVGAGRSLVVDVAQAGRSPLPSLPRR
jgi:hypothetical protein